MKNKLHERSINLNSKTPYESKYVSRDSSLKKKKEKGKKKKGKLILPQKKFLDYTLFSLQIRCPQGANYYQQRLANQWYQANYIKLIQTETFIRYLLCVRQHEEQKNKQDKVPCMYLAML